MVQINDTFIQYRRFLQSGIKTNSRRRDCKSAFCAAAAAEPFNDKFGHTPHAAYFVQLPNIPHNIFTILYIGGEGQTQTLGVHIFCHILLTQLRQSRAIFAHLLLRRACQITISTFPDSARSESLVFTDAEKKSSPLEYLTLFVNILILLLLLLHMLV